MLEFQTADYCMLIWDSTKVDSSEALRSLEPYTGNHRFMRIEVQPFDKGTIEDKAKKVLEEAADVRGALQYEGEDSGALGYEIADVVTASINLAQALWGDDAERQLQYYLDNKRETNKMRGYYDGTGD